MLQLCKITERNGEAEYDWFTIGLDSESDYEVLEQFFGEITEDEFHEGSFLTYFGGSVYVSYRDNITEEERQTLSKFRII